MTNATAADVAGIHTTSLWRINSISPSSFKLDTMEEGDHRHQGAPLVLNVKAEQRSGTKYVDIEAYVVLGTTLIRTRTNRPS